MRRKQYDSRVTAVWMIVIRFRDRFREQLRGYFDVSNAEISRKFPLDPDPDQYPQCRKYADAIDIIHEMIDIFGTDFLTAIAKEHGCTIVDPSRNREAMILERTDRLNEINAEANRLKEELAVIQNLEVEELRRDS